MKTNQRLFVAVLSLASLGLGSLPFLAGAATLSAPFEADASTRMAAAASAEGSLFLGHRPEEHL
jgi:hypothetical protein